ncbi:MULTISPECIES: TetR/AcrR family transcriptional regulator [Streptomyces]|uniref:TetR family transcriptional regulator n=1 Tax=Streptomyces doudnae TaxID=3075536 RepID=A0ABD5EWU3_9ACTN|nr:MULTISPECIES: TetR/AcrR family transcriptional regulator [unclassified Streptomyces]MDT0439178.1 TetR family transcriptional regulator [Streptomyces sp. DSM 41981]SCE07914.1 transcriptional regulator, TetR family [Streptomyces sp. SolWspMP-5a-2]
MATRRSRRDEQVSATREALLDAAERLFAEHGVHTVANRQISLAAGQGNNAAVSYHFGTKTDLVRAVARRHAERIEIGRQRMMAGVDDSTDLREWVACAVRPVTEHLEDLGTPSWYARFMAQVMSDPALRADMNEAFLDASPSLRLLQDGLNRRLPDLPPGVHAERGAMTRHLITQMTAERERSLADNTPTSRASWREAANGLIDVIVALWLAPVTQDD